MALRHKIHPNTVSEAYQNLVEFRNSSTPDLHAKNRSRQPLSEIFRESHDLLLKGGVSLSPTRR